MKLIDFSDCKVHPEFCYGGANGKKIAVEYNNEIYMLKLPPKAKNSSNLEYSNSNFSEYITCHIFNLIGLPAQQTLLGKYKYEDKEKMVCACKDITQGKLNLIEFSKVKNSVSLDSDSNGEGTELNEVLDAIEEQKLMDPIKLKENFWDMFIIDAFCGNFDRHNGNWALLRDNFNNITSFSPIYDCDSCLYPQLDDETKEKIISGNKEELEKRIYIFPNSALRENNQKINYFNFISSFKNKDCNEALKRITPKINLNEINLLIDDTPILNDIDKTFYKLILKERFNRIIEFSYQKLLQQEETASQENFNEDTEDEEFDDYSEEDNNTPPSNDEDDFER